MTSVIADLKHVQSVLEKSRFAGMDQNPKGVHDMLYSAIQSLERSWEPKRAPQKRVYKLVRYHYITDLMSDINEFQKCDVVTFEERDNKVVRFQAILKFRSQEDVDEFRAKFPGRDVI